MRVKFRGKTFNITNQSDKSNEFYAEWNYYIIEIFKNSKDDFYCNKERYKDCKYYVVVTSPLGGCIVDGSEHPTQSKCLQEAFDNIDLDLTEKEKMLTEKNQLITEYGEEMKEEIDEIEYWFGWLLKERMRWYDK